MKKIILLVLVVLYWQQAYPQDSIPKPLQKVLKLPSSCSVVKNTWVSYNPPGLPPNPTEFVICYCFSVGNVLVVRKENKESYYAFPMEISDARSLRITSVSETTVGMQDYDPRNNYVYLFNIKDEVYQKLSMK